MFFRLVVFFLCLPFFSFSQPIERSYLKRHIHLYKRPVTFLAVGNDCYSLVKFLAEKYEGVFVVMDHKERPLKDFPFNCIHLNIEYSSELLKHLGEAEHFDIVFARIDSNKMSRQMAQALFDLGENVFVSMPYETKADNAHLSSLKFICLKKDIDNHRDIYRVKHRINFLRRTHWLEAASDSNHVRHIHSTYKEKKLHKNYGKRPVVSTWLPGINLMTFKILNGSVPNSDLLQQEIMRIYFIPHLDWMPNNIIVQGENLALIDFEDPDTSEAKTVHDDEMLRLMLTFVKERKSRKIPQIFQGILKYNREQIHPETVKTRRGVVSERSNF